MHVKRRVGLPLSDFHVMNRGARRMGIFADSEDYARFTSLMGRYARKYGVVILSWCLVVNHYHVVARATGDALWRMIRDLEREYCRHFNRKTGLSGCLFQGPFKSNLLPDMHAVAHVCRYVHANARDMGVAPDRYTFSSCGYYLGRSRPPAWLDTAPLLGFLGGVDGFKRHLDQVPPKRRRGSEFSRVQESFIRHVEDRCRALMDASPTSFERVRLSTLVCWKAHKIFGIPVRALAEYYGFASGRSVSAAICRYDRMLEETADLKDRLSRC